MAVTVTPPESTAQSMVANSNNFFKQYAASIPDQSNNFNSEGFQPGLSKKRRESIDLGNGLQRRYSAETLPFMRRMKAPEESK